MPTHKSTTLFNIREGMKAKGWSLRTAAPVLGVHFTHIQKVLAGERHSQSLVKRIAGLPAKKSLSAKIS